MGGVRTVRRSGISPAAVRRVYAVTRFIARWACHKSQSAWRLIQNSGDIFSNRARRIALSAVMARRPRMIWPIFNSHPSENGGNVSGV